MSCHDGGNAIYTQQGEQLFSCLLLLQMNFPDSLAELSYLAFLDVRPPGALRDTSRPGTDGVAAAKVAKSRGTAK